LRQLASFQERYPEVSVMVDGAQWSCRSTAGAGPALIMLPGVHGTADLFYKLALQLGHRLNILTVTYPGWADCDRLAHGLARFMDSVGLRRASVCGAFLGGYIAQKLAHRHPERIETLFLVNSFFDPEALKAAMPDPEQFAALPAMAVMDQHLDWIFSNAKSDAEHADLKDTLLWLLSARQSADMLKSRLLAVLLAKPMGRVPLPDERVVLMDSDDDSLIPPSIRAAMRARYVDSDHHSFEPAGHHLAVLRPDAFGHVLAKRLIA
jgi:pimeloyl-ACP methyl ester carboxylesterase